MKLFSLHRLLQGLLVVVLVFGPTSAFSQLSISIGIAPPPLVSYDQPPCPDDGYLWVPGYWAYGDYGYYWVPGTWVLPPDPGLLWTPPYWAWNGDAYQFYPGYWGANVGFYGGIDYGYGYGGNGYGGGRWRGNHFYYNTAVNNVGSVAGNYRYADNSAVRSVGRTSYNGGRGGIQAKPTAQQRQYSSEHKFKATAAQVAHYHSAAVDRSQLASVNGGRPATTATATTSAYKRVALQHVKSQPLTKADAVKTSHVTHAASSSAGGNTGTPSHTAVTERKSAGSSESSFTGESHAPATATHEQTAPRTESRPAEETRTAPRPEEETHAAPRPEQQPRPEERAAPHPEAAPRPQAAPHPEAAPHPAGGADRPGGDKPQQ